jgi:precorrin-3B C17-methyltransferase
MTGSILVVGIGPGDTTHMTPAAQEAITGADLIVGYKTYLKLIAHLVSDTPRESSGMRQEVDRVARVIALAQTGKRVALISGGDAGVYGLAGLVYTMLRADPESPAVDVEVIPGISALNAAAALLGAPLMTDFAAISLSDQLVPREDIMHRLERATEADFVLCLYNPKSRQRTEPFELACAVMLRHRAPDTPVGIVRAAYRERQQVTLTTLAALPDAAIDMVTLVIVGNSETFIHDERMVTPRGYANKYDLGAKHAGPRD